MKTGELGSLEAKILKILERPSSDLPVVIDLPRLAAQTSVLRGDTALFNGRTADLSQLDTLCELIATLYAELEDGDGLLFRDRFRAHFAGQRDEMSRLLSDFVQAELLVSGQETRALLLLKCANQAVIAPAVIALKKHMGMTNMTRDVARSWTLDFVLEDERARVVIQKKELHIGGQFLLQWQMELVFALPDVACKSVELSVIDLQLRDDVKVGNALEARGAEIKGILQGLASDEILRAAEEKRMEGAPQPAGLDAARVSPRRNREEREEAMSAGSSGALAPAAHNSLFGRLCVLF